MKKSFLFAVIIMVPLTTSLVKNSYSLSLTNPRGEILNSQSDQQQKKEATATKAEKVIYTCPMHPEVMSEKPGKCPKCGMNLVKKEVKAIYTCPMHPEVISDKPGKCPKCGMNLVIKESDKKQKSQEPMKGM